MDSVRTQTFSIGGDGGGEAYIDFCDGQLCVGNGILLIGASGYYKDRVTVNTTVEVKSPYKEEPEIF